MNEDGDADGSDSVAIATLPDSGDEDVTRDCLSRDNLTPDSDVELEERPAKKFKHEKLQNTEELARQLLGDL